MNTLRICLFGQPRVYLGVRYLGKFPTLKAQQLFCYLVFHRQRIHPRNVLAGLFWGDSSEERARQCLRTTLWRLSSYLTPNGNPKATYLLTENDGICFNVHSDYWLDVEEFENSLAFLRPEPPNMRGGNLNTEMLRAVTRVVELYQGDLLEGYYEEWSLYERERLQGMFLRALASLMNYHRSRGAYNEALHFGERILRFDPLLEEVHREMMRMHYLAGNRGAALRQHRFCRAVLAKELGIEPMPETATLYAQICRGEEALGIDLAKPEVHTSLPFNGSDEHLAQAQITHPHFLKTKVDSALGEFHTLQTRVRELGIHLERGMRALETLRQALGKEENR